jgi:hypothetical protein
MLGDASRHRPALAAEADPADNLFTEVFHFIPP